MCVVFVYVWVHYVYIGQRLMSCVVLYCDP